MVDIMFFMNYNKVKEVFIMKNKIKILRAERNLTQEQLARDLGISRPALSDIENSKTIPSGKSMFKIASYFNVPIEDVFLVDV